MEILREGGEIIIYVENSQERGREDKWKFLEGGNKWKFLQRERERERGGGVGIIIRTWKFLERERERERKGKKKRGEERNF